MKYKATRWRERKDFAAFNFIIEFFKVKIFLIKELVVGSLHLVYTNLFGHGNNFHSIKRNVMKIVIVSIIRFGFVFSSSE